jgi:uncharacterized protein YjeT (DUF2065 family)
VIVLAWAVAVAAVVLSAAGVLKLVDPAPTAQMARALGLPFGDNTSRLVGIGELVVGVGVLASGAGVALVALGVWYLVFTAALAVLRVRSPATRCGCIGRWSGPPSLRHLAVNSAAAACALGAAVTATAPAPAADSSSVAAAWFWVAVLAGSVAMTALLASSSKSPRAVTR